MYILSYYILHITLYYTYYIHVIHIIHIICIIYYFVYINELYLKQKKMKCPDAWILKGTWRLQ